MRYLKALAVAGILGVVVTLTGCASVPIAEPELQSKALKYAPPPEMAAIYLFGPGAYDGAFTKFEVILDSEKVGTLLSNTYIFGAIQPGNHTFKFRVSALGRSEMSDLTSNFHADPGNVYFLKVATQWYPKPMIGIERLSDADGQKMIKSCKQSAQNDLALGLVRAAALGNTSAVTHFLEAGEPVNSEDVHGMTALMWAAAKGNLEMAEVLIQHGADINRKNKTGTTPLMCAGSGKSVEMVELLLAAGAQINCRENNGFSAFSLSCQAGNADVALYLYDKGADPSVPDKWVEMNGKVHHILGDYFLSLDDNDKARDNFMKAQANYEKTRESYKGEASSIQMKEAGIFLLTLALEGVVGAALAYNEQSQSRQFVQITTLKHAEQAHVGVQGYSTYMAKYDQPYVPTYSATNLAAFRPLPDDASLDEKERYAKDKVKYFDGLQALMSEVVGCFDKHLTGIDLHKCVEMYSKRSSQ